MPLPIVAQRDDQQLGALQDALDLQLQELVTAGAQRFGGAPAFLVDQTVHGMAQTRVGDADEAPWLHQPHTRGGMCGLQQPGQDVLAHGAVRHESAHVPAFGDGPVDGPAFGGTERVIGHARQPRDPGPP